MNLMKNIKHRKDFEEVSLVVHIPKGSDLVYEYKNGYFQVVDELGFGPEYPTNSPGEYGLIPKTHSDNGEYLDCLTLVNEGTMPGIVRKVRPIGMLNLVNDEAVDQKLIAVQTGERFKNVNDTSDLEEEKKGAIKTFFKVLNEGWEVKRWKGKESAKKLLKHTSKLYKRKFE